MQDKTAVDFTEYISFYLDPYNLQGTCYTQNHTYTQTDRDSQTSVLLTASVSCTKTYAH